MEKFKAVMDLGYKLGCVLDNKFSFDKIPTDNAGIPGFFFLRLQIKFSEPIQIII
jgi:hypothetical protein